MQKTDTSVPRAGFEPAISLLSGPRPYKPYTLLCCN